MDTLTPCFKKGVNVPRRSAEIKKGKSIPQIHSLLHRGAPPMSVSRKECVFTYILNLTLFMGEVKNKKQRFLKFNLFI